MIKWHRDRAASGWRSRAWVLPQWELIVYDTGSWEVPPNGFTVAFGDELSHEAGQAFAIRTFEDMRPESKVLHLMTQRDQPYGSVRRCCECCGLMYIPMSDNWIFHSPEQFDEWPDLIRCDAK